MATIPAPAPMEETPTWHVLSGEGVARELHVEPQRGLTAAEADERLSLAGIVVQIRMITGDHAITAGAIATELGIPGRAISGAQFADLSEDEAAREIDDNFARIVNAVELGRGLYDNLVGVLAERLAEHHPLIGHGADGRPGAV